MSEAKPGTEPAAHPWRDREGNEWEVSSREGEPGLDEGWVLRSTTYSLVVLVPVEGQRPSDAALHGYLDRHHGRVEEGPPTARLWIDPRSGIEWEVSDDAGEIVFRNGTEVVRSARGDGQAGPRAMSDEELQKELDEAESGH